MKDACRCDQCEEPEYYSPEDLALKLSVSVRTIRKWAIGRLLPVIKIGKLNRFPRIEIEKRLLNGSLLRRD